MSEYQHETGPSTADKSAGDYVRSASTASSEGDELDECGEEPYVHPLEDHASRDNILDPGNVWDNSWDQEFGQLLGHQFLDPLWLEYSWLESV